MQTLNDIRSTFLNFFKDKGHHLVPSSPLVPRNDPTLLFTAAGMVQFKDVFTGAEKRPYARAASSQKCLRAGGKHNDLENVGYTTRHHTFFEMLGNFSFGDYFKEEAISYAWELVTRHFCLPPERLLVTVYAEDEEAAALWRKIAGLGQDRIIRIATSDNFWSMGETGPCGPCTEIFYDHGESVPGGPPGSAGEDGDRFMEIWNLVFMQYEQLEGGKRIPLPRPSVDTGMGLERMATVLQGVHSTFDTDIFQHLIAASEALTGGSTPSSLSPLQIRQSHNIIADHLRACSFLLADGIIPGNEGRGYVLRRIMRRAMRHAHILGADKPLMEQLVPTLIGLMGTAFPELERAQPLIIENLHLEEEKFRQTLERGLHLLKDATATLRPNQSLPGDIAFKLYDTFGFPLDLTQDVLKGSGRAVDVAGFQGAMAAQKKAARAAWSGSGEAKKDPLWFNLHEEFGASDFLGYTTLSAEGLVQAILIDGYRVEQASAGQEIMLIANQTPFYAESGGQMGDQGYAVTGSGGELDITDTLKKEGNLHVHKATVTRGALKSGETIKFHVDAPRRACLRANHSATHLLHAALRQVLGAHVTQKGSLVAPERLRFDFTHTRPLTQAEVAAVERLVNEHILHNQEVQTRIMGADEAITKGAMALFGEKYGDEVRVLTMGSVLSEMADNDQPFSIELCAGTHVSRTGDIGLFKITGETGIAAGIRRIEGLTGLAALDYLNEREATLMELSAALKSAPADSVTRLNALLAERKNLERQVMELRRQASLMGVQKKDEGPDGGDEITEAGGLRILARHLENTPVKELKSLVDRLKKQVQSGIVVVTNKENGKTSLLVGVTDDLTGRISAVDLINASIRALGGRGGGGRPDLAQAGGNNGNIPEIMAVIHNVISAH